MKQNDKPDHPKLSEFLAAYRKKHGVESAQVKKDNTLHPRKAATAWTKHLKGA